MKIPTFTSRARLTGEAASVTSNIQIDPRQNIAAALRPIGKAAEDYYIKEKAIETKVKAGELNADATVEIFNAAEQAEVDKDIMNYNAEINKSQKLEEANFSRMQGTLARQQARAAEIGYYAQAGTSLLKAFG